MSRAARKGRTLVGMALPPDTLVVGVTGLAPSLDPRTAQDYTTHFILSQVLEPPFSWDRNGAYVSRLLRGGFRFQTAHGAGRSRREARVDTTIAFSDGVPLSAEDVAQAIERVVLPDVVVEARGDRVTVEGPDSLDLEPLLAGPHANVFRDGARGPVGTGAYRIEDVSPSCVRLLAWDGARCPPRTPAVEFRVFPRDPDGRPTALVEALERGEVDLSMELARDEARLLGQARKVFAPGGATALVWFNTRRPHFAEGAVRRSVAAAIDPYAIAASCYGNPAAFVAASVLPRNMTVPGLAGLRHDPDAAAEALAAAPRSLPPRLQLLTVWAPRPYLPRPPAAAAALAGQLERIGVQVDVVFAADAADYLQRIREGAFDLVLGGWIADSPDPIEFLRAIASRSRIPGAQAGPDVASANYAAYASEAFEAAISSASGAAYQDRVRAAVRILAEEAPVVGVMYSARVVALSRRVEGFDGDAGLIVPDLSALRLV